MKGAAQSIVAALFALLATAPALGEIGWTDVPGSYELTGAQLFKLRAELPPELGESLKTLRNISFTEEAAFREALDAALLNDEWRAEWSRRLIELAGSGGAAFGIETRDGDLLTLYASGPDHAIDQDVFTSSSWLSHLPPEDTTSSFTTRIEGGCLAIYRAVALFRLCRPDISAGDRSVVIETEAAHIVGLGQEFQVPGDTEAERNGYVRSGTNLMGGFNGGANGNTLFPIAYFDLPGQPFALILDNRYPQQWDFEATPHRLTVKGGDLRLRVLGGDSLAELRRHFMALSGHPPVPPKSMFGLWLSEYGFESWDELDAKIAGLRAAGFPLSGAVLDLYWFGGIRENSAQSPMGGLNWDLAHFPDPAGKIGRYAEDGIGVMLIEESYVSSGLAEYAALAGMSGLAHDESGRPLVTNAAGNWWGRGGMIDWLVADAAARWHDWKRQPLVDMGVAGHWTDLGEPEMVNTGFRYGPRNLTDPQVRNSYNLLWAASIFDGYQRNAPDKRPFILSRSGGIGLQALGGAMWSGDTGGDFGSLAAQMPQQQHMMWSGMDYYGSDVGGFHRGAMGVYSGTHEELTDDLYTQWLAYSALFEVPVRPHTENLCNCKETAPDRIGDVASNLANLRLRYGLLPYYYALAYRAWRDGEPVFPSLDYYYDDAAAKGLGHEKMIGSELLGAAVASAGAREVELYLPAGDWYDFRSGSRLVSQGETVTVPTFRDGRFELPLYARDGAIVPMADGVLRVFGGKSNTFDSFDDDGMTTAYQDGAYDQARIAIDGDRLTISQVRGEVAIHTVSWTRDEPVRAVLVAGTTVAFERTGTTTTIALPPFSNGITVELR